MILPPLWVVCGKNAPKLPYPIRARHRFADSGLIFAYFCLSWKSGVDAITLATSSVPPSSRKISSLFPPSRSLDSTLFTVSLMFNLYSSPNGFAHYVTRFFAVTSRRWLHAAFVHNLDAQVAILPQILVLYRGQRLASHLDLIGSCPISVHIL